MEIKGFALISPFTIQLLFLAMFLLRKPKATPPSQPMIAPDNPAEPPQLTVIKTLVIVYDPVVDKTSGKKLSQYMNWSRVEELAKGYMSDILQVSGGLGRYQIIQRIDVDDFPAKADGYKYDAQTYLSVVRGATLHHMPQEANLLCHHRTLQHPWARQRTTDEIWVFIFPRRLF
jgi:hypothetical protein